MSIIEKAMEKAHKQRAENSTTSQQQVFSDITEKNDIENSLNSAHINTLSKDNVQLIKEDIQQNIGVDIDANLAPQSSSNTSENIEKTEEKTYTINPIPELIMANEHASIEGGSYRILKEYIIALRKNEPNRSVFMVTSPMKGEGKTLVSCNLACALASEFDTTVLLVDVDLRAPRCHQVLGIENPPKGLSDCLLENTPIADCLIPTGIGKLSLLCAGSLIENPAELITSKRMHAFLQEVKHRYPDRIVILDSLPLLPFAESRALSRMTDGVMLVVRENETYKHHLESALQQLQDVPFLGMIYNAATTTGTDKDIYNLSRYAYGY